MLNHSFGRYVILGLVFLTASVAQAFDFSLVGAVNFASPSLSIGGTDQSVTSKASGGGGVLLGFDLNDATQLEIGGLYVGRHFAYAGAEHSYFNYEIPVVLRLIPLKYLTFGVGPYFAMPKGQDSDAGTSARTDFDNDFGFLGSMAIKFPLTMATNFLVDGRYLYGITNASALAGQTLHSRDVQILVGLNFNF